MVFSRSVKTYTSLLVIKTAIQAQYDENYQIMLIKVITLACQANCVDNIVTQLVTICSYLRITIMHVCLGGLGEIVNIRLHWT